MTLKEYGFRHLATLTLGNNWRICRKFAKAKRLRNKRMLYAFVVGGRVRYIGQTKDLYNRMDSYSNGKYWNNTNPSHVKKSEYLTNALHKGQTVSIHIFTDPSFLGDFAESAVDVFERDAVSVFNPELNEKLIK